MSPYRRISAISIKIPKEDLSSTKFGLKFCLTVKKLVVRRKKKQKRDFRIDVLIAVNFVVAFLIVYRLFVVQVINYDFYTALAQNQHEVLTELIPERGQIFARDKYSEDLYPLASNQKLNIVYAVPNQIQDEEETARKLAEILEMDQEEILARIQKENDLYEPLKNKVTDEKTEQILEADLPGIGITPESWRIYPEGNLASHILGFVGYVDKKRQGRYGVEGFYEEGLVGEAGFLEAEKDVAGRWISIGKKEIKPARDGDDLILTIDRAIQYKVEAKLLEAVEKWGADSGSIIIMDPQTGGILALANYPNYDNNQYSRVPDIDIFNNAAIFDRYEPGSAFKPVCMAIALDEEVVSPNTTYTDLGSVNVGGYTIHNYDYKTYGVQTMTNVLEKSINTGMVFVNEHLGADRLYNGLVKFGFNDLTGIDLDSEAATELKLPKTWRSSNLATIGYGQGIAVTPIKLVTAFSTIANQGNLMVPRVVSEIIHHNEDGSETYEKVEPKVVRQVVKPSVAATLSAMLVSAVENGFAKTGRVPGYHLAGKTGTAQIPLKEERGYDPDKVITSFIGYGPIEDPRFVILVKLDNPKSSGDYRVVGANTAGPVFRELAQFLVNYYQIPPAE